MPVFVEKDTVVKANSLNFVQVDRVPATALLEPVKIPGLGSVSAVPGVYKDQKKIAVLNLEGERVLRAGMQIAEITPTKHAEEGKGTREDDDLTPEKPEEAKEKPEEVKEKEN